MRGADLVFTLLILSVVLPVAVSFLDPRVAPIVLMGSIGITASVLGFRYVFSQMGVTSRGE